MTSEPLYAVPLKAITYTRRKDLYSLPESSSTQLVRPNILPDCTSTNKQRVKGLPRVDVPFIIKCLREEV